jgi:spore coat-associated protein N
MQRFAAVWHASPQKMVGVLFALLLAAMMAVGSGANFNSTSANPGNVVTAGNLSHINGKDGQFLLTASKLKPGESQSGTVTMKNDGDIDGVFSVARTITQDTTGALTPSNPFAAHLNLKIEDTTTGGAALYDDLLSTMSGPKGAVVIAPGATHTFKFTVTFNDGGANGADNAFKAAQVKTTFNWEAVNN